MKIALSLFDGMSCGQLALQRAGISVDYYLASEVDQYAMTVAKKNFPETEHIGDVREVDGTSMASPFILMGGSPCQSFSFAGKRKGMATEQGEEITTLERYLELKGEGFQFSGQSYLFWEYVRILRETKPKYFLLENVKMAKKWEDVISETLGVCPIVINSALVSAQNRKRLYWTNIPDITQPEDRGLLLRDIIEIGEPIKDKSQTILATLYKENAKSMIKRNKADLLVKMSSENPRIKELSITDRGIRPHRNDKRKSGISEIGTIHYPDTKSYTITANHAPKVLTEIIGWRKLTPKECERLQTAPDNYTDCVSDTQRYKMLGNGWTVDVIAHILRHIPEEEK